MERTRWKRRRIERKWRRSLGVSSSPSKWTAFQVGGKKSALDRSKFEQLPFLYE